MATCFGKEICWSRARKRCGQLLDETEHRRKILAIVGLPVYVSDKLYNAAAVFQSGRILGVVPKAYIPNYSEYYEQRWFASGIDVTGKTVGLAGQEGAFRHGYTV